ncbi:MAG: glycoside hydrolase family 130 protein [Ignavibacteriales bacterium]
MGIFKYKTNPVLTKENVPFRVNSIFNAGAVKFKNEYILLCRVEMPTGRSSFVMARSKDGLVFTVDKNPCLTPEDHEEFFEYVEWGIEDPRITKIKNRYYITYTGYSNYMPLVMLASTDNFRDFKIHGPITEPSNKDCALFPEKINGYYWKMDRPSNESRNYIWLNRSPDLLHWGGYRFLLGPTPGTWEADKVGGSTPPVKTKEGWLLLYHGVRGFGISNIYKISTMLLDLKEPWKVIGRSREPILMPDFIYERVGDVGNVVFTNGWIAEDNGDIKIYYSGADSNICLATTTADYLLNLCK